MHLTCTTNRPENWLLEHNDWSVIKVVWWCCYCFQKNICQIEYFRACSVNSLLPAWENTWTCIPAWNPGKAVKDINVELLYKTAFGQHRYDLSSTVWVRAGTFLACLLGQKQHQVIVFELDPSRYVSVPYFPESFSWFMCAVAEMS